jgi:hypothetical protein
MGLVRGIARTAVIAGTATAVSNRVSRRQGERWAEQSAAAAAQAAPPPPPQDDTVAELEQLARLRDQGILTEDEFAAKKRQILGI